MKKFVLMFLCFNALMIFTGCSLRQNISTVEINNKVFQVELAQSSLEHYQGLSGRQNLSEDQGMLFVFDDYQLRNFVMRDMNFSLDIVWIKDDKVVGCEKNVPILDQNGLNSQVNSKVGANLVLEINAGLCKEYDMKSGDAVIFKRLDR